MRNIIVHEFVTLDGILQAPGGPEEDTDGGFTHGGWTRPYWHDGVGATFGELMTGVDAFLLGRRTYVTHAQAFEPMAPGDFFGDMMNKPAKYVVSRTLDKPIWRGTTILRDDAVTAVKALKASAGGTILCDGSSQLVHALIEHDLVDELFLHVFPIAFGRGKKLFPATGLDRKYTLVSATPYPTGVVGLRYRRAA